MTVQIIGCVITMLIVMFLCMKGVTPLLCGPIAAVGICLSCQINVSEGLFTIFAGGVGSLIASLIMYFVVSCMFAEIMQVSGSADSIANFFVKVIGAKHAPMCVILICGVLTVGGLGLGAMIIAFSIGQTIFKKANYSRNLIYACIYCGTMFAFVPFIPSANNMLGDTYLAKARVRAGWLVSLRIWFCLLAAPLFLKYGSGGYKIKASDMKR